MDESSLPLTEQRHPDTDHLDQLDPEQFVRLMIDQNVNAVRTLESVRDQLATAITRAADVLRSGGRLFYVGAGTSGRLGMLDASECPPTFSTSPEQVQGVIAGGPEALVSSREAEEDRAEHGASDLRDRGLANRDLVIGISAGGRTPYVRGALEEANRREAETISVICVPRDQSILPADLTVSVVTGPEILTGSTRMKAGTATKVILNTISTGAMIQIGKAYQNLMVDLQMNSNKLEERGIRIVREVTGLDRDAAVDCLKQAKGNVKRAIVMDLLEVGRERADELLSEADGHLRDVIGSQSNS